jgi:hypothetical protein
LEALIVVEEEGFASMLGDDAVAKQTGNAIQCVLVGMRRVGEGAIEGESAGF